MSRVYRYEELALAPLTTPENFHQEVVGLRQSLGNLVVQGAISGAFLYGSALADANPRSDIDLLAATPTITQATRDGLRAISTDIYHRSGIPVDVSCFSETRLTAGRHGYYRANLLMWLKVLSAKSPENIVGRNPIDFIKPLDGDLIDAIDTDLTEQRHAFEMAYMKGHAQQPEALLETILNFPHKAGRECMSTLLMHGYISPEVIGDARKDSVARAVAKTLGAKNPRLQILYGHLVSEFSRYTKFADEVSRLGITREEYDQSITATIQEDLPVAIELVGHMQTAYRQQVGDRSWPSL